MSCKNEKNICVSKIEKIIQNGGRIDNIIILKELRRCEKNKYNKIYLCKCDCGEEFEMNSNLIKKNICLKRLLSCKKCSEHRRIEKIKEIGKKTIKENGSKYLIEKTRLDKLNKIKAQKNNTTTNYAGIRKKKGAYEVTVGIQGKQIYLGRRKTLEEAIKLRTYGVEKYHIPFMNKYGYKK